jgi:phosphoribosylglycinamide formyltransferase 1
LKRIAIFASGSGTNAENIMQYFSDRGTGSVSLVLSNKKDAMVLERAERFGVKTHVFNRQEFYESHQVLNVCYWICR